VAEAPEIIGIDVLLRRTRAPPASNFASLAAIREGEKEGEGGGLLGIYRVVSWLDLMPGNGRNQEELTVAVLGAGRTKVEDDLLVGSHLSTVNEKERKKKEGGRGLRVSSAAARLVLPGSA
jgi:hypothetical protein